MLKILRDIAISVVASVILFWVLTTFFIGIFVIPSGSMEPTLQVGEHIIVNKLNPTNLSRGDVIVFKDPGGWLANEHIKDGYLVKRVIGLPGDTVACCNALGQVTVNGMGVQEPYVATGERPSVTAFSEKVPAGELWVMGDNRLESNDSRYQPGHFVPLKDVVGRAVAVYWPFSRARWLPNYTIQFDSQH